MTLIIKCCTTATSFLLNSYFSINHLINTHFTGKETEAQRNKALLKALSVINDCVTSYVKTQCLKMTTLLFAHDSVDW